MLFSMDMFWSVKFLKNEWDESIRLRGNLPVGEGEKPSEFKVMLALL